MMHTCHAHGCQRTVPPAKFVCPVHWLRLPAILRAAIYREYRTGQERTKTPTVRYMAVQRYAVGFLAHKDYGQVVYAAPYLAESQIWRAEAIAAEQGDPLAGIATQAPPFTHDQADEAWAAVRDLRVALHLHVKGL